MELSQYDAVIETEDVKGYVLPVPNEVPDPPPFAAHEAEIAIEAVNAWEADKAVATDTLSVTTALVP